MTVADHGRDVFRHPGFARFWTAETVSDFGSYITTIALQVLMVLTLHGSATDVGLLNASRWLPYLLLAARQHLKRGLLLYGPPGTGKTHTVRYLVGQLTGTTIVELTGDSLGLIGQACSVARSLQPAMIVVEDVDLIAEDRGMHPGQHPLLFQLLNEMDGLAEDADVVFLLTTNRADLLEPALAARPGRVDQAVELGLPDADGRRQLFALYRGDLVVDESRLDSVIERTAGVTASFLKELLRRAAVVAASEGGSILQVSADHLDAALDELLDTRNAMTRVLLGGQPG